VRNKAITMTQHPAHTDRPTGAWISFSYISFGASLAFVGGGIIALPLDLQLRCYLAIGFAGVICSSFMLGNAMAPRLRRTNAQSRERRGGQAKRGAEPGTETG
jgi:hypothetical protein